MFIKCGTMLLAVTIVGSGLLAGAAQPAQAKTSDTVKVIAGFAAGYILSEALSDDHGRRGRQPQHYRYANRCDPRPTHYSDGRRYPGHTIRIEHRPVWRPQAYGHGGSRHQAYRKGYRHGYRDGYRDGDGGCRCGVRHVGFSACRF